MVGAREELVLCAEFDISKSACFGFRSTNSSPNSIPRFGVIRLAISAAIAVSRPSGVLIVETVGSDSSSFTNGSSVESVAGKKRAPAKPWPLAGSASARAMASNIKTSVALENFIWRALQNLYGFLTMRARKRVALADASSRQFETPCDLRVMRVVRGEQKEAIHVKNGRDTANFPSFNETK
jgi:hypothetical protein